MLFLLSIILTGSSSIYGQSAVSPEGADAYVYSLVTDASSLAAGDQFVIVNEEASVAMGADRGNNRAQVKVEITDHTISKLPDGVQIVELVKTSSKWYLKVGNEYLYAPKGSNNFLKTTTNGSPNADYGKATIVIGEKNGKSNVATITFSGADNSVIGHLGTLFSCYSPTLTNNREVFIYRREPAATFDVTMGSAGWRTLICAQNVSVQDGYQAYTVTGSDASSVMLTNVATVKAGSPYLLSGPEGTCTLTVVDVAEEPEGNLLAVSTESDGNDVYVLANKSHGVGFYRWDGDPIGSGRVILPATAVAGESREFFGFDEGGTTSISEKLTVKSEKFAPATEFFNLNGQRVTAPTKGLYIVNGRKVVVK